MAPPRRARAPRARPRRGSVERPVNARLVRGNLASRRAAAPPDRLQRRAPAAAAAADAAADLRRLRSQSSSPATWRRKYPDRSPGSPGSLGAAAWISDQFELYGFDARVERFTAQIPGRGKVELRNVVTVVRGASQRTIVITAHRDNIGGGAGRQPQRVRHGRPDRARARFRIGRRRDARAGEADVHTRLRLDRRRRVRRARCSPLRRELALPGERAGRDQPRCARGLPAVAAGDRRRHGAFALGVARPNCGRPRPRADRRRTDPGLGASPAAQSRLPVHAPRARPVRGARHSGLDPDDAARGRGRGIRDDRLRRHVRRADARGARPRVAEPDRIARRRSRAHPGNDELHLLRHAHRPRLGDRARPDDGAAAVPDRHDRPVRALPAPPDPARAGRPQPPPPALLLGLRRSAHLRSIAARRLPAGRAAAVAARPEPLRALARGARHPRRAAAHRLARRP